MRLLKNSFIVSCQALEDEPLYGPKIMQKMMKAALLGGADGIRTSQIDNVKDFFELSQKVPLISLIKKTYPNSSVFITPTLAELKELMQFDNQIIAIDATLRKRPAENLDEIVDYFHKNRKKNQYLLADCADYEDVENAIRLKFDYVAPTLRGYTETTKNHNNIENNYEFLRWMVEKVRNTGIEVVAEGGFNEPQNVIDAFKIGVHSVVVGSMITRPYVITKFFVDKIRKEIN
ncbi:N-acetylmannosamine-6-phosphate 2-epimerase [Mesomycoplasma ovipneumoniae]|uniref:N-acetylmannosamine-6-phosphate 2-epimerase n=1 Tax=Mesomycoplasma ovipneumoniae TaxID=29562 RepID=UPI002079B997|nr:N-acetylmannosamine-6-phosphate 2-epimerase [Mesomycoplasma ovipneumoniae]MCN0157911.1 N-acetylmannosamine-6-phosphate 2-epimerase [Mesomycoplasma ovipneumoniae]MDO6856945.1 N-acetylmannosamine-6-phosphate 2-epimerase [Mesomycoplasma ovipneumoniae]